MATIGNDPGGRKRILFYAANGSRKTVRLGKASQRDAEHVCRHVEALAQAMSFARPLPTETAAWVDDLRVRGDVLLSRLAAVGLVEQSPEQTAKLGEFVDQCITARPDVKAGTRAVFQQARNSLVEWFGESRRVDSLTTADADAYRAQMIEAGLKRSTVAKRVRYAKHFLGIAVRRKLIRVNPFAHLHDAVKGDPARRVFVPAETVQRVLEAIPDPEFRLIVALARWGGLRTPSEPLALTWRDIDLGKTPRMVIRASKTEHHEDAGVRVCPIFPELQELFQAAYDAATEGAVYVIQQYRDPTINLRKRLTAAITAAGVKPWPKLFQNLRVSRATELADLFPSHVCAAWLGHSERVADAFYRQVTDEHMERATCAARNPARQLHTMAPNGTQSKIENTRESQENAVFAEKTMVSENDRKGGAGLERAHENKEIPRETQPRGTKSGTIRGHDLETVCRAWPRLPEHVRAAIVTLAGGGE